MRPRGISGLIWGAFFVASLIVSTKPSIAANCALYVRAETGVALYGAAGGWWDQAEGRYQRGHLPAPGAILVFKRTGYMRSGHVALVTKIVGAHEILVDHANWYHGTVSRGVSVIDTSPNHDWSTVAVMELRSGKYGRDNPAFGFVYPGTTPREIVDPYVADSGSAAASLSRAGLVHFAIAAEYLDDGVTSSTVPRRSHRKGHWAHRGHAAAIAHTRGGREQPSAD
jgi:hypothetical protein